MAEEVDPARAIQLKDEGNRCFVEGDWKGAERRYLDAIKAHPTYSQLYTNLAMAYIKQSLYSDAAMSALSAIELTPKSMKAHFHLAQSSLALGDYETALREAETAHSLCVQEIREHGRGMGSLSPITDLVLKCWEDVSKRRDDAIKAEGEKKKQEVLQQRSGLEAELLKLLQDNVARKKNKGEFIDEQAEEDKLACLHGVFHGEPTDAVVNEIPDWFQDPITLNPLIDPVITKSGNTYERASILKHLERNPTDPVTRERLVVGDLMPNLALRDACRDFLEKHGQNLKW